MVVTATEMKCNFGKYLEEAKNGEIVITKNGKSVAKLVPVKHYMTDSIIGLLADSEVPEDIDAKSIRAERLEKKYGDYL